MSEVRRAAPALEVRGLDVYYGHSHALQGVDLTLDSGVFSVVGRNGMGKTTLCKTIMGLLRASGGSVRVRGEDITRLSPARIAQAGVGYVPQGRRLWRSLSVAEHLSLAAGMRRPRFTPVWPDRPVTWKYRGQVTPRNRKIVVESEITEVGSDGAGRYVLGDGWLWVDGNWNYGAQRPGG